MLGIYMRVLFLNGIATIGMYAPAAIRSQKTPPLNNARPRKTMKSKRSLKLKATDPPFLYMRLSSQGRPVQKYLYLLK